MSNDDSGIYQIVHTGNGKRYVGSASSLRRRKSEHFRSLRQRKHANVHLQRAWNQSGEDAFVFEVLERCEKDALIERENYWIEQLKPQYNIHKVAKGKNGGVTEETRARMRAAQARITAEGRRRGGPPPQPEKSRSRHHIRTDEERQAIYNRRVQASRGRVMPDEAKEKIRQSQLGKKVSPETIEKLRQSHVGQVQTPEMREKNRQAQLGRTLSPEAREKIRQSKLGKKRSPELREKLRQANLGKKQTPEHIAKRMQYGVSEETKQKLRDARNAADIAGKPHGGIQRRKEG